MSDFDNIVVNVRIVELKANLSGYSTDNLKDSAKLAITVKRLRQRLHRQPDSGHGNRTAKKKTRPEKQDDSRQLGLF